MPVPHRRRTARTVAMIVALTAPAAGCDGMDIDIPPGSMPVPVTLVPAPSGSWGQPKYICSAIHRILLDGAARLATGGTEQAQRVLADMAGQVTTAGEASLDPAQRAAADSIAARLTEASRRRDPKTFVNGEFTTIGQKLDGTCT